MENNITSLSVEEYLKKMLYFNANVEGNVSNRKKQVEDINKILNDYKPINVLEIGFNSGHSSELFLENNNNINYLGFDIGINKQTLPMSDFMKLKYGNRFNLIIGDSIISLPEYIKNNNSKKFDLIFIDGGHDYKIAKSDFDNCKKLSNEHTIIIFDDVMYDKSYIREYNKGPNKVWKDALDNNEIIQLGIEEYQGTVRKYKKRGMVWGKFKFI